MYSLHLGDCLDILPTLAKSSVSAIIADLPYGTTTCAWDSVIPLAPLWVRFKRVLKERGAVVLFGAQPFTSVLVQSNLDWFKYTWVWEKDNHSTPGLTRIQPLRYHEDITVFYNKQCTYNPQMWDAGFVSNISGGNKHFGGVGFEAFTGYKGHGTTKRYPKSVIQFNKPKPNNGQVHPTQKPVALLEYLVKTYTNPDETVLDCTMGSGTTGVACINTGRDFIGIELEQKYFETAVWRIEHEYWREDAQIETAQLEMAI